MSHVDAIYNFGHRINPIWIVLKDLIQDEFLSQKFPSGGLRKSGKLPNIEGIIDEVVSKRLLGDKEENPALISSRDELLFEKYAILNSLLIKDIQKLKGEDIIFIDSISPTKLDPQFLFRYLQTLDISYPSHSKNWYSLSYPDKIQHDPYSPMFALTDAILLMAKLNPKAWDGKIIWPLSIVPFPSRVIVAENDITLEHAFPGHFSIVEAAMKGKIALGDSKKSFNESAPFIWPLSTKIGSFQANPLSFDRVGLEELFDHDPKSFESRIQKIRLLHNMQYHDAKEYAREEIAYTVFLKKAMASAFYLRIFNELGVSPVIYSSKGSAVYKIASLALNDSKLRINLIGPDNKGPIDTSKKSAYGITEFSALERLNGYVLNKSIQKTKTLPRLVNSFFKEDMSKRIEFTFEKCPYAPVVCEGVYTDKNSCARETKETQSCTRDLFHKLNTTDFMKRLDVSQEWIDAYNKSSQCDAKDLAEIIAIEAKKKKFIAYSAEQVIWLLNKGPNYEVITSSQLLDNEALSIDDKRRFKARSSWFSEKKDDIIFPLDIVRMLGLQKEKQGNAEAGKDPFMRISSFGTKCDLARIIAMHKEIPPYVMPSVQAVFGSAIHFLMNGSLDEKLFQEDLLKKTSLGSTRREKYTETEIFMDIDGKTIMGHSDCVLIKASTSSKESSSNGRDHADLVIVDYKTAVKTYLPSRKYVYQLGSYALAYVQNLPMTFNNFYLVIVNRPLVSDTTIKGDLNQTMTIIKMQNKAGDPLYEELIAEQKRTILAQGHLLENKDFLHDFKREQLTCGACDNPIDGNYSKTGCYDDQRQKCTMLFQDIGEKNLSQFLLGFPKIKGDAV